MKLTQTLILTLITNLLFSQAGNLDLTFGDEGKMITSFEQLSAEANAIGYQSDGKIILTGIGISASNEDIIAVRYLPNGQLDTNFGVDGRFILSISNFRDRCYDIVVDTNENIFMTGYTANANFEFKGFIIKLNMDGDIDSTFAQNGIWISETPNTREDFREILLQSDGKILIAGKTEIIGQPTSSLVIRLNSDGTIDNDFGENGIANSIVPDGYNPKFAKLNSKEEIITGGFLLDNSTNIILIKFNQQGEIDLSFGVNGVMVDNTILDEFANSIAIQNDDKIIVGTGITNISGRDFGMVRFNQNGSLDTNFGSNGRVSTDFSLTSNTAHSVILQEDGKIILGGFLGTTPNHDYAIARYDTLGNLDVTFGNDGKVITDFELDDLMFASTIQSDGKLLCAGTAKTSDDFSSFSIARYLTQIETSTFDIIGNLNQLKVFPNPSDGNFSLSFELEISTSASISLFNSSGNLIQKIINNKKLIKGLNTIDINLKKKFGNGLFIMKIKTDEGSFYKKLIIER